MTEPEPTPLSEVDLSDLDRFRDDLAWGQFDTLRREDRALERGALRSRLLVRDPVRRHLGRRQGHRAFSSEEFVNLEDVDPEFMDLRRSMLETDGPRHQAMRALIAREFSPRNLMKNYEGFLRELTKQTVDEAFENEEFDFVEKISGDFPIQVLARLLDVPKEDTGQLIAWGDEMVGNTDPDYTEVPLRLAGEREVQAPAVPLSHDSGGVRLRTGSPRRSQGRRGCGPGQHPGQQAPDGRVPLTDTDFDNYFLLLVIAGNETTRQAISNTMIGLMRQPTSCGRCRRTPRSSRRASRSC